MDDADIAEVIKGKQAMERRWQEWLRLLAYFIVLPHTSSKNLKPEDLITLSGDEVKQDKKKVSDEELTRMKAVWAKWDKKEEEK